MKIKSAELELSAPDLASCPRSVRPEFALIGRSNVGKSSLINSLTQRRNLARVSSTPGKTQLMNFFLINASWRLVDLPGYGYAKISKEKRFEFNAAAADYLSGREHLTRTFVLIDSRLEPQAIDLEFISWLEPTRAPYALIFTKVDKHSTTQGQANVARFLAQLPPGRRGPPQVFLSSAETGSGRTEILQFVEQTIASRKGGG
jgi:GTP-binding protein